MKFAFDLISDLHVETWDSFDWTGQPTSPYCVVAGDVSRDRTQLTAVLGHLGKCYHGGVFYIDGNDEHKNYLSDLSASYSSLQTCIERIPNVVYLQDHVVIVNGVAFLGTNSWWTFDFDRNLDMNDSMVWWQDHSNTTAKIADSVCAMAYHDSAYLASSVHKLQTHQEVRSIVIITHTVPGSWICEHDIDLSGQHRFNSMGASTLAGVLREDTEHKIKTWCFGHYHKCVDQYKDGVRYVNNPRGRGDTSWCQSAYYPKRVEIEY